METGCGQFHFKCFRFFVLLNKLMQKAKSQNFDPKKQKVDIITRNSEKKVHEKSKFRLFSVHSHFFLFQCLVFCKFKNVNFAL